MSPRKVQNALFALLAATGFAARAGEPVVYGPDGAPTVVQRKLHVMTGRMEVGLAGSMALNTALVDHAGGLFSISYHPNEWLDAGVDVLGNATSLSQLSRNVRQDLSSPRAHLPLRDELANDNQLRLGGLLSARVAPIYGKLNLASELAVHFQAYALAGAGVALVHRESVNLCADPGTTPVASCQRFAASDSAPLLGQLGAGLRFYAGDRVSLRTEVRGFFFRSSYLRGSDLADASGGTPKHYLAAVATVLVGVSRTF